LRTTLARLLACVLLAGCTKIGTTGANVTGDGRHAWTRPHELRVGSQVEPNTLDPLLAANTTEDNIDHFLFDNLVSVDQKGNDVPMLASVVPTIENGGISKDGLTITYHLRKGVKWSDGYPLTSKDVKFSWSAILNPNNNIISQTGYELVRSVETPDDWTVVFHMKQKFSPVVNTLFAESDSPYEIVPEHILGKLHDINKAPFNSDPVTSGPFRLKEWVRGDHLSLIPNDAYFLGKPNLKEIDVKFIPDENTEVNALRTHDIDWQFEASPQEYLELKSIPDIRIVLQDRNENERISLNIKHPPLDDVRVRQAIAFALDLPKLTSDLTGGSAAVADEDLPPFMWAYAHDISRYHTDLAKSRALFAHAGWKPGPDGALTKNGQKLNLTIVYNVSNATRRSGVVQVQSMLRAIGVDVSVKAYQGGLLFASLGEGGILQSGKYDLSWTGWVAGVDPDQSSQVLCDAQPPHGNNSSFYCNPELDRAEQKALDHFDIPTRKAAYAEVEAILTRDLPIIPIWWPRQIQPINPDFKHFAPNPVTETWNSYTWDI
jgi:peptide/nickel transport system substrate-binding protein